MTSDQAKAWAAEIARDSSLGPNGEPAKITKDVAASMAATIGALLAASDLATGYLDPIEAAKINAGRLSALAASDPDSAAFSQAVAVINPNAAKSAAFRVGAKHITDSKGGAVDPQMQAEITAVALVFDGGPFGAAAAQKSG